MDSLHAFIPESRSISFPDSRKGTYILILRMKSPADLAVGKLGTFHFRAGWYAYVGSALNASGLSGRLRHHLSPLTKFHWHIDYLRQSARVEEIWYLPVPTPYEHAWAAALVALASETMPVPGFGSSDCACQTHLFYFAAQPDFAAFHAHVAHHGEILIWKPIG